MKKPPMINWSEKVAEFVEENQGFINICYEALDRHLSTTMRDRPAIRYVDNSWPDKSEAIRDISFIELATETNRFAHALKRLGVSKGDVLFSLCPRVPEFYTVAFGTLRAGVVFSPLFSVFGSGPILSRMRKGRGKVLFTLASYYRKKILPIRSSLVDLKYLILIDDDGSLNQIDDAIDFHQLMQDADPSYIIEKTSPTDPALLHFTSGTTGEPKGAIHVHEAVLYHKFSGLIALDLRPDDLFWCTADPGWVTGTSYGILSPICNGVTLLVDGAEFSADRWYQILTKLNVTNWYTAPTALRMLMRAGSDLAQNYNFKNVRYAASVGEPLNPEVIHWVKENLGIEMHDNWWQTETGGILISNYANFPVRPGSMGVPMTGIEIGLVKKVENNKLIFVDRPGEQGEIAVKRGWPSMFVNYLGDPEKYQRCFLDDWYLSGDLAKFDDDGYYWFVGRKDDVIKTSGHLVGPFEIESLLMEHEAVLESAAIGIPDPIAGELIKAFIVLKSGYKKTEEIKSQILAYARLRLGVAISPREIQFVDNLPKTKSGKIMRRLLKARQLGLPEGDLSTLEQPL
jgi:acetyl-CoA synthetase